MDTETGQGFIKQRRNLISISLILFFYQVLGVKIDTLNIFGTTVKIENSFHIALILWIACLYLLLRYYQYYKGINIGEFKNELKLKMTNHVPKTAFRLFKKNFDLSKNTDDISPPYEIELISSQIFKSDPKEWKLDLYIGIRSITQNILHSSSKTYSTTVNGWRLIWPRLKSYINVTFTTRFVTEYHLPFLLALIPIAIQIILWIILFHKEIK